MDAFYIACRLVAIAQAGQVVEKSSLAQFKDIKLPEFGPTVQQFMPTRRPSLGSLPPSHGSQPSIIRQTTPPSMNQLDRRGSIPMISNAMPQGGQGRMMTAHPDPRTGFWKISDDDIRKYLGLFMQADEDQDGFVGGKEGVKFFKQSKIDGSALRDIWVLADVNRDNKLSKMEFVVAMFLVMKVRVDKTPLPKTLPVDLVAVAKQDTWVDPAQTTQAAPPSLMKHGTLGLMTPIPTPAPANDDYVQPRTGYTGVAPPIDRQPSGGAPADISTYSAPVSSSNDYLTEANNALRREMEELKLKAEQSKLQNEKQKIQLDLLTKEKKDMEEQIEFESTKLEALEAQVEEYVLMLQHTEDEVQLERGKLLEIEEKIHRTRKEIETRKGVVSTEADKITSLRQQQKELNEQHETIIQMISDEELSFSMAEHEITELTGKLEQIVELIESQSVILKTKQARRETLDAEKVALNKRLSESVAQLSALREESKSLSKSDATAIGDIRNELIKTDNEIQSLKDSNMKARAAAAAESAKVSSFRAQQASTTPEPISVSVADIPNDMDKLDDWLDDGEDFPDFTVDDFDMGADFAMTAEFTTTDSRKSVFDELEPPTVIAEPATPTSEPDMEILKHDPVAAEDDFAVNFDESEGNDHGTTAETPECSPEHPEVIVEPVHQEVKAVVDPIMLSTEEPDFDDMTFDDDEAFPEFDMGDQTSFGDSGVFASPELVPTSSVKSNTDDLPPPASPAGDEFDFGEDVVDFAFDTAAAGDDENWDF